MCIWRTFDGRSIKTLKIIKLPVIKQGIPTQKIKHSNSIFFLASGFDFKSLFSALLLKSLKTFHFDLLRFGVIYFLPKSVFLFAFVLCWCERGSMIYILTGAVGGVFYTSSADHVTFDTSQALMHLSASLWKLQHRRVNRETHFLPRILSFWFCNLFPPLEEAYFVLKKHVTLFACHSIP